MTVVSTIHGYGELFWADVVAQIDSMNEQVLGFQAQAKKLPKVCSLRHSLLYDSLILMVAACHQSSLVHAASRQRCGASCMPSYVAASLE